MINLETQKAKASTRILSNIADENNMKYVLIGFVDENITEEDFNRVIWLSVDTTKVTADTKSLPSPVSWVEYKSRLDEYVNNIEYRYNRQNEYPSIVDQLDLIFNGGLDAWKEQIQAIKDKYPKP